VAALTGHQKRRLASLGLRRRIDALPNPRLRLLRTQSNRASEHHSNND
jgi:hypothetical protein